MLEYFFYCPYCWQHISILIDTHLHSQKYIEDCEVCCNPIQISFNVENNEIINFDSNSIGQQIIVKQTVFSIKQKKILLINQHIFGLSNKKKDILKKSGTNSGIILITFQMMKLSGQNNFSLKTKKIMTLNLLLLTSFLTT